MHNRRCADEIEATKLSGLEISAASPRSAGGSDVPLQRRAPGEAGAEAGSLTWRPRGLTVRSGEWRGRSDEVTDCFAAGDSKSFGVQVWMGLG